MGDKATCTQPLIALGSIPSPFRAALDKYITNLPAGKHKKDFIAACYDPTKPESWESVEAHIVSFENTVKAQTSGKVPTIIRGVVRAFRQYDDIVKTLASADPMPSALIWGGLSIIIKAASNHSDLLDKIGQHLERTSEVVERLPRYDTLWGKSEKSQDLLFKSYTHILRLLSRIHKALNKKFREKLKDSLLPQYLPKLAKIVEDLDASETDLRKHIGILKAERALTWHENQMRSGIGNLLRSKATEINHDRYQHLKQKHVVGTCSWLEGNVRILRWMDVSCDTASRIMPLFAPPGSGKSTFCAYVIDKLLSRQPRPIVIYHFYRFDQQIHADEVLRHFASQLFYFYSKMDICSLTELERLEDLAKDPTISPRNCSEEIIQSIISTKDFPTVWFFLDGLDEESSPKKWKDASLVVHFLLNLSTRSLNVRLWTSSQNVDCIAKVFEKWPSFDIGVEMWRDANSFLEHEAKEMNLPAHILDKVVENRDGGFIWANALLQSLKAAITPAEQEALVEKGLSLDEYHAHFFKRIEGNVRSYACRIFSLVAFARRPLRLCELREALAIHGNNDNLKGGRIRRLNLDPKQLPFPNVIQQLCRPLMVFEGEKDNEVCRLYHSTLLRFFERNPDALCDSDPSNSRVCPRIMAEACILYLSQERYSTPLKKTLHPPTISAESPALAESNLVDWVDSDGNSVRHHQFLSYAAKYWDKHFDIEKGHFRKSRECEDDNAAPPSSTLKVLHAPEVVAQFLESKNFKTCLQIQSLFVDGQFSVYGRHEPFMIHFKRVLPDWLAQSGTKAILRNRDYPKGYQEFCIEWHALLDNSCLPDVDRWVFEEYKGDVDRCWWAALSSDNFLSKFRGNQASFRFENTSTEEYQPVGATALGISQSGERVETLRVSKNTKDGVAIQVDTWNSSFTSFTGSMNKPQSQTLKTEEHCINRGQFSKGRAKLIGFNEDATAFRVGTQIYIRNHAGLYMPVHLPDIRYVEEIARQGPILAVASRQRRQKGETNMLSVLEKELKGLEESLKSLQTLSKLLEKFNRRDENDDDDSDGDDPSTGSSDPTNESPSQHQAASQKFDKNPRSSETSSEESNGDSDSSTETSDSSGSDDSGDAYESWSDCSTNPEGGGFDSQISMQSFRAADPRTRKAKHTAASLDESSSSSAGSEGDAEVEDDDSADNDEGTDDDEDDEDDDEEEESGAVVDDGQSDEQESEGESNSCPSPVSDDPGIDRRDLGRCRIERYGEEHLSSEEEDLYGRIIRSKRTKKSGKKAKKYSLVARLRIFDITCTTTEPEELFSFGIPLKLPLVASPPAIHPQHSLVVWPLSGGKVLFGDFEFGTYFIRKLKTSTTSTRQIFMKPHFSSCGSFIHIASLEGQVVQANSEESGGTMSLAVVASTFRLCTRQPTRTPPVLHHTARVDLGHNRKINIHDIPISLTWSDRSVYVTDRSVMLKVYCIDLFPSRDPNGKPRFPVRRLNKPIPLPATANRRTVHFFPSTGRNDGRACVILGPDSARLDGSSAIGCSLNETEDLGGWIRSSGIQAVPNPRGNGQLILPLEKFDPEEDCDLEPYLFLD